ncbi:Tricalbin-2 [Tilletia horrida]|uniref:Tricalbin-2 n=1 Tax=Tilletia horrida TaxID=155126 RepID=A0AAN6GP25_9BASI|nr:Tricalbin-2 [Tilletia horrida]KAK0546905.1 Tricalbin-2 [Tilletia horrida]KAK0567166.1 Tricalbin-2 [Tilletia horrida]
MATVKSNDYVAAPAAASAAATVQTDQGGPAQVAVPIADPNRVARELANDSHAVGFKEEASPEEKSKAALAAVPGAKPKKIEETSGAGMASDIGGQRVKATTNLDEIDRINKLEQNNADAKGTAAQAAGVQLKDDVSVGWTGHRDAMLKGLSGLEASSFEQEKVPDAELKFVQKHLGDGFIGYWWYDGAAIAATILATYFATRFGGGIFSLLVIGAFCSTYYNATMRRTRQRSRDDISRELIKRHMDTENESTHWINLFLDRFWAIYEPVLCATVIQTVDSILVAQCPSFLDSIRLTTFRLGTKAPHIEHVRSFPGTADDIVQMDWKFGFTPNDVADLTVRQNAMRANPKIVLTARLGRGKIGAGLPILVEDMMFKGSIRLKMKLISNYPHVQVIDFCFMEPPEFDYVLKPIGGNMLGFDVGIIPGLSEFVRSQVHANLGPMMYFPNMFTIDLEQLLSGTPLDTACGVLQVTIYGARQLKATKFGGGQPDPYVSISIDDKEALGKTKWKHSTVNPQWKETKFILLNNLNGMLTLVVNDFNQHRPDTRLGIASFDLKELENEPEHELISTPVVHDAKDRGEVQYSLSYYPVIKPEKGEDGKEKPLPNTTTGIVRLSVFQAKELDKRSGLLNELNPFARIRLNGQRVKDSKVVKRTYNPAFDINTEFLVTDRKHAVIGVEVIDDRELTGDSIVGQVSIKLDDLLAAKEKQQDWFPLAKSKNGRLRMAAQWKPVLMSGSKNGGNGYQPAIGVVKFWLDKAIDVKNVEALTGGKSDPYVAIKLRGQLMAASTIVNNNLNPIFNEILYTSVHNLREKITVEVMDYQNTGKDRSLGTIEVELASLAKKSEAGSNLPYESTGRQTIRARLNLGRGVYKGELLFDAQFLPGVQLKDAEFEGAGNEMAQKTLMGTDDGGDPDEESAEAQAEEAKHAKEMSQASVKLASDGEVHNKGGANGSGPARKGSIASLASVSTVATLSKKEGVLLSAQELLASQSGVFVFNILSGNLARKNVRLEIAFDDAYWPTYTTEAARTAQCTWDEVGEEVIKELDWSRMWMKLRSGSGEAENDVFAEFQGNTKDILERALNKPAEFTLEHTNGAGKSTVTLVAKYIPVDIHIEPAESVNNQGYLTLTIVSAKNLRAADRNGKSDPYVKYRLNGKEVAKSKTIKKTVNPEWNEKLEEITVPSRVAAESIIEVYDFDQLGAADPLGSAVLNLAELEPFESVERTLPLGGKGANTDPSSITVRMVFRPEFVTGGRERKGTSIGRTFTQVGGVAGGVGKLGVKGVTGVAGGGLAVGRAGFGLGKGAVGGAVGLVTGRGHGRKVSGAGGEDIPPVPIIPESADGMPAIIPEGLGGAQVAGLPAASHLSAYAQGDETNGADDSHSFAESSATGTPKKKGSRFHNPFKKHDK